MRPWLRKVVGVCCIVGGILFGIFPFVPGVLLIIVGLELLGIVLIPWDKLKWFRKKKEKEEEPPSSESSGDQRNGSF